MPTRSVMALVDQRTAPVVRTPALAGPLRVAGVALLIALAFVTLRLAAHNWDPTAFVRIGDRHADTALVPDDMTVIADNSGYDGQYFYRLARSPFSTELRVDGIDLDRPAYRNSRIGYPAVAWVLSGGGRLGVVPWALIVANVLAVGAIGLFGALLARDVGRSPWFGLAAAGLPGITVALGFDLAEPLEAALLLGTLVALRRRRWWWATGALTFAILTRETALVLAAAVLGARLLALLPLQRLAPVSDRVVRVPVLVGLVPAAAYAVNMLLWSARWAGAPKADSTDIADAFTTPFHSAAALASQAWEWITTGDAVGLYQLVQLFVVLLVVVIIVRALVQPGDQLLPWERLAGFGALAAYCCVSAWERMVVFLRYPTALALFGLLAVLAGRDLAVPEWARPRMLAQSVGVLWATTALVWVVI